MKIAVIGAGIIGVTTAYELGRDGHEVTVFERRGAAAEETSFANAGIVAPGYVTPWATPGMPRKVLGQMLQRHASVRVGLPLGKPELAWMWKWYRSCTLERYLVNRAHMRRLAFYSRARMLSIRTDLRLEYDRSDGYMVLLRSERDRQLAQPGLQVLRDAGVAFRQLEPDQARLVEPALSADTPFAGPSSCPTTRSAIAASSRCCSRTRRSASACGSVSTPRSTPSCAIRGPTLVIKGDPAPAVFDAVVVCAGVESTRLLQPVGITLPLVAVYGYSLSASIKEPLNAPRSAVMDEHYKVAISRLGNRIRVAGSAEIGGTPTTSGHRRCRRCTRCCRTGFPAPPAAAMASRSGKARARCCRTDRRWSGQRPCPACGSTWDMAPADGHWPAARPARWRTRSGGSQPELDMQGFDVGRFAR